MRNFGQRLCRRKVAPIHMVDSQVPNASLSRCFVSQKGTPQLPSTENWNKLLDGGCDNPYSPACWHPIRIVKARFLKQVRPQEVGVRFRNAVTWFPLDSDLPGDHETLESVIGRDQGEQVPERQYCRRGQSTSRGDPAIEERMA